jgi:hypothetical protein
MEDEDEPSLLFLDKMVVVHYSKIGLILRYCFVVAGAAALAGHLAVLAVVEMEVKVFVLADVQNPDCLKHPSDYLYRNLLLLYPTMVLLL